MINYALTLMFVVKPEQLEEDALDQLAVELLVSAVN